MRYTALIFFIGCAAIAQPKTLIVATPDLPTTADPVLSLDVFSNSLIRQIHRSLFHLSEGGEPRLDLAEDFTLTSDGLKLKIEIRHLKFHDGTDLSADIVKASLERAIRLRTNGYNKFACVAGFEAFLSGRSPRLDGIKRISPNSISIQLNCRAPRLLHSLADQRYAIVRTQNPSAGLGAYRIVTGLPTDQSEVLLKRVSENAEFEKIKFVRMPFDAIGERLSSSESVISYLHPISNMQADFYRSRANVNELRSWKNYLLAANSDRIKTFEDRSAIFSAVRREEVINKCYPNEKIENNLLPAGFPGYRKNLAARVWKSKKKLRATPLVLYVLEGVGSENCVATVLKAHLEAHGFRATVKIEKSEKAVKDWMNSQVDLLFMYLEAELNVDILQFFAEESTFFLGVRGNREMQKALKAFGSANGLLEHVNYAFSVQNLAIEQATALPFFIPKSYMIYSRDIQPIHTGMIPPTYMDLSKLKSEVKSEP